MKLGTETGSVMNNLMSRQTIGQPDPEVGMGATILMWSDRRAATITKVTSLPKSKMWQWEIEVCGDRTKVVAGSVLDGSAEYEYEPVNPANAVPKLFRFSRKTGLWVRGVIGEAGRFKAFGGNGLRIGERDEYRDPTF